MLPATAAEHQRRPERLRRVLGLPVAGDAPPALLVGDAGALCALLAALLRC